MTKTEIHPDHSIMTKIKSFNIKLKESPKIKFQKRTNKKKNPKCVNTFTSVCFIFTHITNNDENTNQNFKLKRIYQLNYMID